MTKDSIQQEDITLVNINEPNIGARKYIKQILINIKKEIDSNKVIAGEGNTVLTPMDWSSRQKIDKETATLYDILDQIDLIDIFRASQPKAAERIFFLKCAWNISQAILLGHMLSNKASLNKFRKIWNHLSLFSDHNL